MIYDKKSKISRYLGLSSNLDAAIRFIQTTDLAALPQGRTSIRGDSVFVNRFCYMTAEKANDSLYEDHAKYMDLHFPLSGSEFIAVEPSANLQEVEKRLSEDAVMYSGEVNLSLPVSDQEFLVVYPGEAHLPKLMNHQASSVDKLVFKIRL